MPPKGKGKKGKKGQDDDDAFWEAKAAALDLKSPAAEDEGGKASGGGAFDALDDDEEGGGGLMSRIKASKKDKKKKKNAFADLEAEDDAGDNGAAGGADDTRPNLDDEWPEDDVKPKGKKGKKGKAQKAQKDEDDDEADATAGQADGLDATRANLDDEWPEDDVKPKKGKKGKKGKAQKAVDDDEDDDMEGAGQSGIQTPAEDTRANLDDEWPEDDVKPKGKKGKKGKAQQADDEEAQPSGTPAEPATAVAEEAAEDAGAPKILSKKEKEKLKKEKEKEKKKAQAAAKRAAAGDAAPAASPAVETQQEDGAAAPADDDADGDDVEAGDAAAADKKKKKKKKPAAKPAEPVAAPAAKGKKVPAHIAAMQAAMAEKQRMEEESRRAEEERRKRIEEEEAALAAEEAKAQAQKEAKKAKEKEKRDIARKEGRLLTPAQKREKAAAEARKQALLNAGVQIAGLQSAGASGSGGGAKRPIVNKKKGPAAKTDKTSAPATPEPASPVVETPSAPAKTESKPAEDDEDDWDKSEDDAAAVEDVVQGVDKLKVEESEDDWDKSDEDEAPPPPKTVEPAAAAATKPAALTPTASKTPAAAKAAPAPAAKPTLNGKANGKPAAKPTAEEESSDEEDDDDDEDSSSEEDSSDESDSSVDSEDERRDRGAEKVLARRRAAEANKNNELRSPICCILGHVDHGKTRLLDKIRQTSVAEGEAGGITQQIGATFFPADAIKSKSDIVNTENYEVKIPGLLIIDTPGHEAFANLRTRGSSLCNIAILVVDITQSFQPQTVESLNLLKKGKTPFIVALNKIDKLYGWQATPNNGFRDSLAKQSRSVKSEFEDKLREVKLRLSEQGLNSDLFDENKNLGRVVSLVPTSAFTGEGIPDMLLLLAKLTQERMNQSLMYISELSCTILEVKSIEGMGMTIDVILSNGHLKLGDTIVLCGTDGPIVTNVRALLTPQPLRELRIKSQYVHNPEVKAALGVKVYAPGLEKAIAGARLFVANDEDEVAYFKDIVMDDLSTLERFTTGHKGKGVFVQASTLGALEALLTFLQSNKVPVFDFGVGPVFSRTIRSHLLMLERAPEYACILAFDVPIDSDAKALADKEGLKIFTAPVIYHLFDAFQKYLGEVIEARKRDAMGDAVWPVRLSIIQAFAHRDPIILGCDITEGSLRVGTPVGVVRYDKTKNSREIIKLGKITSLEKEHKSVNLVKKRDVGGGIAVKIERAPYETARLYGRHFDDKDEVVSLITRQSIDTLKNVFRDSVTMDEWKMIKQMKIEQGIP